MPQQYDPAAAAAAQPATASCGEINPTNTYFKAATSDNEDDDEDESDASLPRKKLKTGDKNVLQVINLDDIQDLDRAKSYLKDALGYINRIGAALVAPTTLRPLLKARPEAALSMAASIGRRMSNESMRLCSKLYNCRKTGITSDDISQAMEKFLPEIEELMTFPDPDTLKLAYQLVIQLSRGSFGDLDESAKACGFGDRPSDEPADLLLRRLIRKRLAAGETWNWEGDLKELDDTCKHVGAYGIGPWAGPMTGNPLALAMALGHGKVDKHKAIIIAGFTAIGKSFLTGNAELRSKIALEVIDLDSSAYSKKPGFPENYLDAIRKTAEKPCVILISTHVGIPTQLTKEGYYVALAYPGGGMDAKQEWLDRLEKREEAGKDSRLYRLMDEHWTLWYERTAREQVTRRFCLANDQYLNDILGCIHAEFCRATTKKSSHERGGN
ncbi:hypothetical protein VPNG_06295 [Cytospora leucostoma]|uniref:Uncharacterized protein n=1 Tax=Cytospora leucostoma TaxID=1230097 RepID=A0A423X2G6_9PEZI|nr:hypothetical protein VPNG_06295 [Cytospora leucostoma]